MDSRLKALEEMSRAQSDHFRKFGEHDPLLQRRIDALLKRAKATPKKKKTAVAKATPKKKKPVAKKGPAKRVKKRIA